MSTTCPIPISSLISTQLDTISPKVHYLLSGTFNTLFLYLLAFSPYSTSSSPPTLTIKRSYRAQGPHQFLAVNEERDRVYATTWAQPPELSSWKVNEGGRRGIEHVNTVRISATGSYLTLLPSSLSPTSSSPSQQQPRQLQEERVYQAGGPVLQTFSIDPETGGFGDELQEIVYLEGGTEELWDDERTDRTRVALRYGSHAVDIDPVWKRAYVPHVGRDSIYVYSFNEDGTLKELEEVPSHGVKGHEGPRHSIPSRNGNKLYVVTEHTSYLDVYDVNQQSPYLTHSQRFSIIPERLNSSRAQYRGDTLRLSLDGQRLYVTTRGKTSSERGYVSVWNVDQKDGSIVEEIAAEEVGGGGEEGRVGYGAKSRFETKTSGGKANAIEVFPFPFPATTTTATSVVEDEGRRRGEEGRDWIVLTDDEQGWVWILEWRDEWNELREVAGVQLGRQDGAEVDEQDTGASHAVWLS